MVSRLPLTAALLLSFLCLSLTTAGAMAGQTGQTALSACIETRAALDIGSASTKLKVAEVDVCLHTLVRIVYSEERRVEYAEDLNRSESAQAFSPEILDQGREAMSGLAAIARAKGAKVIAGVATESFRKAANAGELLNAVQGAVIEIITQDDEARLGYLAAMSVASAPSPERLLVWDIGGGSMQIMSHEVLKGGEPYRGKLASVEFKRRVLGMLGRTGQGASPNPVGRARIEEAIGLAREHALKTVSPELRARASSPGMRVYGIGSLFFKSIQGQLDGKRVTRANLRALLSELSEKTDQQIAQESVARGDSPGFASVQATNVLLVLGFMEALGIDEVFPQKVNLGEGVLVDPSRYLPTVPELRGAKALEGRKRPPFEDESPAVSSVGVRSLDLPDSGGASDPGGGPAGARSAD